MTGLTKIRPRGIMAKVALHSVRRIQQPLGCGASSVIGTESVDQTCHWERAGSLGRCGNE